MTRIDTSFVLNHKVVVRCSSQEEANELYESLVLRYPNDKLQDYLLPKIRQFMTESDGHGTCYRVQKFDTYFDVGRADGTWYSDCGYEIIDFKDLIHNNDYGEFESGFGDKNAAFAALF